ncbi:F-box/kelch-repeat protein At3g23880-like [Rhododendron vialii]|uniref:F-box/kelch-repeat protein At3g23880-like n=1 Tax=Rhododendron vialii TaxID=182163 RepID=UPI002660212C|nr:F-box/kelch-repeat protein At3g23880-like [Rhododendron vialii]XP_058214531.1 F-box/kelch-repeat protein At3g23880-like [Rhododendron vialii]
MTTHRLPTELTTDILLRLPVKSLLRSKSVCKNWYDLIKSPVFIATHLTQFALNPDHNSTSLLVTSCNSVTGNHGMSLIINDGFTHGPINLDFPFLNRSKNLCIWEFTEKKYFSVVGICHGLVCINLSPFGYPVILCNPLTREFREIPKCEWLLDCDCYVKVKWVGFGFGFHPSARDYKLIQITLCSSPVQEVVIRAHLYAMGTDTWREIDVDKVSAFFGETDDFGRIGSFVRIYGSCASAALNGVFYWPARVMPTDEVIVMSFDMGEEVFRRIRTPVWLDWNNETMDESIVQVRRTHKWQFTELKDKLTLIIHPDDTSLDVWVLNEDKNSWTNQFKVGSFPRIARNVRSRGIAKITVVGGAKNGELVVANHKTTGDLVLFSFDPMTVETKDLYFGSVPYPSDIHLYSGALLPVKLPDEVVL